MFKDFDVAQPVTATPPQPPRLISYTGAPSAMFFAEYFPPYMGSDRRIFEIAKNLTDWKVEFAVVPPLRILGGRCEDALQKYFQRHFIEGASEDERGGIHGHYFNLPKWMLAAWRRIGLAPAYALTVPYLVWEAVRHIKTRKPDIIVASHPSYLCGAVAVLAAKISGVPLMLDYPDAWTPLAIETADIPASGLMARILRVLEGMIARSPDRIVSITAGLSDYVRAFKSDCPIDIVANGGDPAHFHDDNVTLSREDFGLAPEDEVVLYSGRLETWSGVHDIVETIDVVVKQRPCAKFIFVGDGTAASELRAEISHRGLERNARFLGFLPYAIMPSVVALADVAIVPFPRTPTTEICSPVKLFEYMLMRKGIITTDLPGVRESVNEDHVLFVEDLSAPKLSWAVLRLLNDIDHREDLAERGYAACLAGFTWQPLAQQFSQSMLETLRSAVLRS